MNKNEVFFLDTETTSADSTKARTVQVAIITDHSSREWMVKPSGEMEVGAIATHHITPEMVKNLETFRESESYEILKELKELWHILVAHNAPYDVAVLENDGIVFDRYIDTLKVAKNVLDDPKIESYSLQYLRYFYNLDALHPWELTGWFAHSALYDTICLKWLYLFLVEKLKKLHPTTDPVQIMLKMTSIPLLIREFRFWKHKWKTFEEVAYSHLDYLDWLYKEEKKKPEHERNVDMIYTIAYWSKKVRGF